MPVFSHLSESSGADSPSPLLSVVMPVYNEAATVAEVVRRVQTCGLACEIIVVDDGSTDGSHELLALWDQSPALQVVLQPHNQGKGAAIRAGFALARGQIVVVQDADFEYDPRDFQQLVQPILQGETNVVYGSRYLPNSLSHSPAWHRWGNRAITSLSNWATGLRLSDVETCYKLFRRELIQSLLPELRENSFAIELELTARLAQRGERIVELPISYVPRGWRDGKKIGLRDAWQAFWKVFRY